MICRYDKYPTHRKHCASCGCWRYLHEFGFVGKKRLPGVLKSRCQTCERIASRERIGCRATTGLPYGRRRQTHCMKGHPMAGANLYVSPDGVRRCKACKRAAALTPLARERNRIYQEAKRRERGVPARPIKRRPLPQVASETLMIDSGPFAEFVRPLTDKHGASTVASAIGLDERNLYAHLNGERKSVHIDCVDRALVRFGGAFLWQLYPDLYKETAPA